MKRSIIITIALIAAIAAPLCASSGWARGLGVLGLTGGGAAVVSEWAVEDDFTTDTSANYTSFDTDLIVVADGVAKSNQIWNQGAFANNSPVGSADQVVRADITGRFNGSGSSGASCAMVRADITAKTGYIVCGGTTLNTRIILGRMSGGTYTGIGTYNFTGGKTWGDGVVHTVEVSIVDATISVKIDWNDDGDMDDADESGMTAITDSAITSGNYAGVAFTPNGTNTYSVDNFKAKAY